MKLSVTVLDTRMVQESNSMYSTKRVPETYTLAEIDADGPRALIAGHLRALAAELETGPATLDVLS